MDEDFEIVQRIRQIMQEKQLTNSVFADTIGVQRATVSQLLAERNKPSIGFITKLLSTYKDIDANWLLCGRTDGLRPPQADGNAEPQLQLFDENAGETQKKQRFSVENTIDEKKIEKIVTFYSDKTFSVYFPE